MRETAFTLPSEKATYSATGPIRRQSKDTRAKRNIARRTANFLGLMASMGKPIKKETTKQAAAPAMQRRKPTKRSQRERAKYLHTGGGQSHGKGWTSASETYASSSLLRSLDRRGIPLDKAEVKRAKGDCSVVGCESSVTPCAHRTAIMREVRRQHAVSRLEAKVGQRTAVTWERRWEKHGTYILVSSA